MTEDSLVVRCKGVGDLSLLDERKEGRGVELELELELVSVSLALRYPSPSPLTSDFPLSLIERVAEEEENASLLL